MEEKKVRVGLAGMGLNTYWNQFQSLRNQLLDYHRIIKEHLESPRIEVVDAGLVDNVACAEQAGEALAKAAVQLLVVNLSTYALSSTLMALVKHLHVPILLLNLQPSAMIDLDAVESMPDRKDRTGAWLAYCQACSVPEFASVLNRMSYPYEIISGHLADQQAWDTLTEWMDAIWVASCLKSNRLGILGHYYGGMLDVYTDLTKQSAVFGSHIELVEMCELNASRQSVTQQEIEQKLQEFAAQFEVSAECDQQELIRAAKTSIAMDKLVSQHRLGALAYYYEGHDGNQYEDIVTSMIAGNTLLTGNGVPIAGECEVKNVQAMKIMSLFGAGGSFSEFYMIDYTKGEVLLGHDGPAHYRMSKGRVGLVPLPVYHGKPGKGLSIQMTVAEGDVTLLSVCEDRQGVHLLVAEGEAVTGPVLQIGNTNSRYRFSCGVKPFIEQWSKAGPSHHCAIGRGHLADRIAKLAWLLGITCIRIS